MQKEIRLLKTSFVASWETCKWTVNKRGWITISKISLTLVGLDSQKLNCRNLNEIWTA